MFNGEPSDTELKKMTGLCVPSVKTRCFHPTGNSAAPSSGHAASSLWQRQSEKRSPLHWPSWRRRPGGGCCLTECTVQYTHIVHLCSSSNPTNKYLPSTSSVVRVSWLCCVGNLRSHWVWGEQEWQRNLKQTHCLVVSGSDPSNVIVQENSWSAACTNASLLTISLWLTELLFSETQRVEAEKDVCRGAFNVSAIRESGPTLWDQLSSEWDWRHFLSVLSQVQYFFKILDGWMFDSTERQSCIISLFIVSTVAD